MPAMTVLGPVADADLGLILPHEHLLLDLRNQYTEPTDPEKSRIGREKISMSYLGLLRRNPYALKENLLLDDVDIAVDEIMYFKNAGGSTVVDCTSIGIHRDPVKLREVAKRTGLNIIAGCGYYTQDTHPSDMEERSVEDIADEMIRDLTEGIGDTGICAGVIGEIGVSNPVHPREVKNLAATAIASRQTNAPVQVHTYMWGRIGLEAVRILTENGADPGRIVICHTDVSLDMEYIIELLKMGVYIEFDNFGKEFYIARVDRGFAGGSFAFDIERVKALKTLINMGYTNQLLLTNDICIKTMLHAYGGWGYDHVLTNIVPMMQDEDIPHADIDQMLRENPQEWLAKGKYEV